MSFKWGEYSDDGEENCDVEDVVDEETTTRERQTSSY